jgi:hypothetical protein
MLNRTNGSCLRSLLVGASLLMAACSSKTESGPVDFQLYMKETEATIAAGKYSEALDRCLWFHEHSRTASGMGGVRLSFALSDWKKLADLYPPAQEAMVKTRDDTMAKLETGGADAALFQDLAALNRTLNQEQATIDDFLLLAKARPTDAERFWQLSDDVIFAYKRYDIARDYIGDVQREYAKLLDQRGMLVNAGQKDAAGSARLTQYADDTFARKVLQLIGFAVATNNKDGAKKLADEAETVVPDTRYALALGN